MRKADQITYFAVMPEVKKAPETFYGMKDGETNSVRIKFRANPKPSEGTWRIGEITVPIGAASVDNKFQSSPITDAVSSMHFQVDPLV